ncbi:MAG: SDR family oxidoreductase [Gammaproteobacteria bacterium]|nr:MAG: SDR family oxidoreductase [Gammaproteobacteria bacterium]
MSYFVTGATGFIGKHLIPKLLARKGNIYCLVRKGSQAKFEALRNRFGDEGKRLIAVSGDLSKPGLGVSPALRKTLEGKIKHFFHLGAIYDLAASAESQHAANVEGTRHAVQFAEQIKAGIFHHTSSIAVAGLYPGVFREDMFDEAEDLDRNPYFKTKHESEAVLRKECKRPYRIYRPAMVLGHSQTGEIDKIDGPYYFFRTLKKLRDTLPQWMPVLGLEGGRVNMVPVDFVVDAMDHIAHKAGLDGGCFHLTDPAPRRIGQVLNIFANAGHAPQMSMRLDARMFAFIPPAVKQGLGSLPPVKRFTNAVLRDLGIPAAALKLINYPTRFDSRETERALKGTKIRVPDLDTYAWRLWDYWERHLDPDLFVDHSLSGKVKGRTVLITGGSSGIGKAAALKVAAAGAKVLICARGEDELAAVKKEIVDAGGTCHTYVADLSELKSCDELVAKVVAEHKGVDILINNAGRSIRRAIASSYDRFHDFERTMQLNYFGSLRLIMGFLPAMTERHRGHIINISSIGVLTNAPRFSAYVASKAALDAFSRCAQAEFSDNGINFTTINMPLVKTPMIAPTKMYESVPTLSPEEAADLIVEAIIKRPVRIATRTGVFAQLLYACMPRMYEIIMNTAFRLFPDSTAAKGMKGRGDLEQQPTSEQVAFASLMRGVHW